MQFEETDPFPLRHGVPHADAVRHARAVDEWLGLAVQSIEAQLACAERPVQDEVQPWIGLAPDSLQTPYTELRAILARVAPAVGAQVVDLGAAYGRMGHVVGRHHPGTRFVGYELVAERVVEGQRSLERFGYPGVQLLQVDLSEPDFAMPDADIFFMYDFGSRRAIEKSLNDLKVIAAKRTITVVGRGRSSRDAIERNHPWLSQVIKPEHLGHYSIYRSA